MAKLFGFSIEDNEPLSPGVVSPVPPNEEDQSDYFMSSGFFGQYVDIEGVYKTEFDLIKKCPLLDYLSKFLSPNIIHLYMLQLNFLWQ